MYSNKHVIKISLPILLSLLAQSIIQVIDTAFLGRVGEVELGASALAGIIYIAIYTIGFGFSMGSQILIGRRNGEKKFHQIGEIVIQGILFLLVPALLLIAIFKLGFTDSLMSLFKSENVSEAVSDYLDWRVYGFVFAFTNSTFRAFYIGIARTKVLTINSLVMALVNLVLDYGLIFGNFGLPEMGIGGAALASVIAEASSTLFFVIYTQKTVDLEKYGFRKITFNWSVVKKVLDISVYMMLQYLLSIVTWLMFFVFIENYLGERPLAVTNIVRSLYTIVTIPSQALGAAVNTMVSNTIGAGRQNEVLSLIKRVTLISLFLMLAIIFVVAIAPRLMIHIYTNDASLINDTVVPLYVLLTSLPLYAVGTVLFSSVSGTGNTQRALLYEIVTLSGYVFYMWFIIVHLRLSVGWAWTTEHVYWGQLMLYSLFYLRSKKWVHKKI
ncbi:MAG TPA: MATE family efflux transporter [Petrimonas sp.]|uniref:MATE family efflux transporter n=1 Tax=Petrimonas sp. TaxID=2023866 RepID=UPI0009656612|nr:MATE family efflux transporter [Petrimonas sp.]MEA4978537.1 MATE family efflux transporter [Petrimonas sp.]MEA5042955.1 MATE family efflux transporter [Petrimonas sp.]OJV37476.1 MAG: MATE family efflux transporter [Bacteroidia bacterium 43-41]HHV84506.1 MATE family efflux transporter [Petrimonas sp.]